MRSAPWIVLFAAAFTPSAWGAPQSASQETPRARLEDLVAESLENNPEIRAAQKRYEAASQKPSRVSTLPDPMFSPGYNSSGAPWPGAGLGSAPSANIGFMVTQEFPSPGKRKLVGEVARREADAEFQQYLQTRLEVVARLKQAYYRLSYAFEAVAVIDRNLELLQKLVEIAEIRYAAGRAEQQDLLKAQTQVTILQTKRVQLEREKTAREAEINSLAGRPPGTPLGRPSALHAVPLTVSLEELLDAAERDSPAVTRDEKLVQRSEAAVNAARKDYYPDFALNAGYYNMAGMPDMFMFRADIRIPLYFFRKQRAGVTEQVQRLLESKHARESTLQSLRYRVQDDYTMARTSLQLAGLYSRGVIPQANLTLESSLVSYQNGKVDLLSVITNFSTVVEYEMNYYEELKNLHSALSRLEELTGRALL